MQPYPNSPGYKAHGTSSEASKNVKGKAAILRDSCLMALEQLGDATPDEVADWLGETPFSIRPRISELSTSGKVVATGKRRKNESGNSANVYRLCGDRERIKRQAELLLMGCDWIHQTVHAKLKWMEAQEDAGKKHGFKATVAELTPVCRELWEERRRGNQ